MIPNATSINKPKTVGLLAVIMNQQTPGLDVIKGRKCVYCMYLYSVVDASFVYFSE